MKLVIVFFVFALALVTVAYAVPDNSQTPLNKRIAVLEKRSKAQQQDIISLTAYIHQIQRDMLSAAQAEDTLRSKVEMLEQTVYHQGNP